MIGISTLLCALVSSQTASPPRTFQSALLEIGKKTDVYAVAVPMLAEQKFAAPQIDSFTKSNVEARLASMVTKLPIPGRLIKLNLPRGIDWTAEQILSYARAESELLRKQVGKLHADGGIEVFGRALTKEKSEQVIEALDLLPVYVVVMAKPYFGGSWQSTYGLMQLEQRGDRVEGTYSSNGGRIVGRVVEDQLSFEWIESNGSSGFGVFSLSQDGESFSGPWFTHLDPGKVAGSWTGQRLRG